MCNPVINEISDLQKSLDEALTEQLYKEEEIFKEYQEKQKLRHAYYINYRLLKLFEKFKSSVFTASPDTNFKNFADNAIEALRTNSGIDTALEKAHALLSFRASLKEHDHSKVEQDLLTTLQEKKFIDELQKYINSRWNPALKEKNKLVKYISDEETIPHHFYKTYKGFFHTGFSAGAKISAARKLKSLLHYDHDDFHRPDVVFTKEDIKALRNSTLGKIIKKYEHLLPPEFKNQEHPKQPTMYIIGPGGYLVF